MVVPIQLNTTIPGKYDIVELKAAIWQGVETRADGYPIDLMAPDVRTALRAIGDVTGENVDVAVLTEIFSRFCIGK